MTESQEQIIEGAQSLVSTPEPRYDPLNGIIVERRVDIEAAGGTFTVVSQRSAVAIGQK
jgi:hypothetical protein